MIITITGFLLCAAVIFYCGTKLTYYGDLIAELTGLSKAWIGLLIMASVTSLPELFVGIGSAGIVKSSDFAVGDVLGSCAFNLAIISILDAFSKNLTIFALVSQSHILAGALGIVLFSIVGIGLYLPYDFQITGWIGFSSILFIVIYLISIKLVYQYDKKLSNNTNSKSKNTKQKSLSLKKVIIYYLINALFVIMAALLLPHFSDKIATEANLQKDFIGTLFLASTTSLPEVAVSIAAIRINALDMAVGNLLGSNLFNIFILAIDDIVYTKGNLLVDASKNNIISVFSIISMTSIAIIGLTYRSKRKKFLMAWDTLLILIIYVINILLLYYLG